MKTSKNNLVNGFIIGTFVSLYILVSIVSTIHVIDFFELSNPKWLAVTLAIGFELGAAASLAALITLDKMNKTLVWALFITITAMQMQGNMYYAFINLENYQGWVELFNLLEWEPLAQKRLLAAVSGAILPLVALGFIKSLVDYIKPSDENDDITNNDLDVIAEEINHPKEKRKEKDYTDVEGLEEEIEEGFEELKELEDELEDMEEAIDELERDIDNLEDEIEDEIEELASIDNVKKKVKSEDESYRSVIVSEDSLFDEEDGRGLIESTKNIEQNTVNIGKKGPLYAFRTKKIPKDPRED